MYLHMLFWKLSQHKYRDFFFKYPLLNNLHNKTLSSGTLWESDHIKLAELYFYMFSYTTVFQ